MSVTAFPVLARILKDRNMTRTPAGRLALGAAAIDDATAWILLAIILTLTGNNAHGGVAFTAIGALVLTAGVFGVLKPAYAYAALPRACRPVCTECAGMDIDRSAGLRRAGGVDQAACDLWRLPIRHLPAAR